MDRDSRHLLRRFHEATPNGGVGPRLAEARLHGLAVLVHRFHETDRIAGPYRDSAPSVGRSRQEALHGIALQGHELRRGNAMPGVGMTIVMLKFKALFHSTVDTARSERERAANRH
jgi:hypothetical protein